MKSATFVRTIFNGAFYNCESLVTVELHEGLRIIESGAFLLNVSLRKVKIPSSIEVIGELAFAACYELVTVELPPKRKGISKLHVGEKAFRNCQSLTNVSMPSKSTFAKDAFSGCTKLEEIFPNQCKLVDALSNRFESLRVHELCYSQSFNSTVMTIHKLSKENVKTLPMKDCFGSTSFHILSQSSKLNIHLWIMLMEIYGEPGLNSMIDKWGKSPICYLCSSSDPASIEFLKCVIQSNIANRLGSYTLSNRKVRLQNDVESITEEWKSTEKEALIQKIYSEIEKVEMHESISLLMLALWKVRFNELATDQKMNPHERMRCRLTCGEDVVLSNVLPFLVCETKISQQPNTARRSHAVNFH